MTTQRQAPLYKIYHLGNFRTIPQIKALSAQHQFDIEVVGRILPFKVNNFVVDELIDWDQAPHDPMFALAFPQRGMLRQRHYETMAALLKRNAAEAEIKATAQRIRLDLNPNPAGQLARNVPSLHGQRLHGMQHKYQQTVLFFPSQGQDCYAYCTFCFRWPQFAGMAAQRFASSQVEMLVAYLQAHPKVTDLLFTGGDPMSMPAMVLAKYIDALLQADIPHLRRIRIGTKTFSYWPYKFSTGKDAEELLDLFTKIVESGKHLAIMAHFNHPREMAHPAVREALARVRATGAVIRTQSPLLRHINDDPRIWAELWNTQVDLGCIPYYMFVARNTGAQHFFAVPLVRSWKIFQAAYQRVSGLARTVRGPSMSTNPGKIQILGVAEAAGEKVMAMRFLQGRNPDWVHRPFFAAYDEQALWLDDLKPAFGEQHFFFEEELERRFHSSWNTGMADNFE